MSIRSSDLLKGVWYSLEQCGRLLKAAAILYHEGDYSTAVGVAMLAREELGKHRILRDEWKKSVEGTSPSAELIRRACEDHIEKQKRSQMSTTLMTESPSSLGTALRTRATSRPGDPAFQAAEKLIQTALETKAKRAPSERHGKRLEGFFVDLEESGTDWKRPSETIAPEEATRLLSDAANDYAGQQDRFSHPDLLDDSRLVEALKTWSEKPALPLPTWPAIRNATIIKPQTCPNPAEWFLQRGTKSPARLTTTSLQCQGETEWVRWWGEGSCPLFLCNECAVKAGLVW